MRTFEEYAKISGLELNVPKTVIVPLWLGDLQAVKIDIRRKLPTWSGVQVQRCGTYLGFSAGPEEGESSWAKAVEKFTKHVSFGARSIWAYTTLPKRATPLLCPC